MHTLLTRKSRRQLLKVAGALAVGTDTGIQLHPASGQDEALPFVIGADALREMLTASTQQIRIIDASPLRTYRANHISGAVHSFWEDTVDRNYPVFGAVITQGFEQQQRLDYLSSIGVTPDQAIVVYDDDGGFRAARIVWFLRFLGYSQTSLLDGGLPAWQAAGEPVASGVVSVTSSSAPVVNPQDGYYVVTEALFDRLEREDTQIVDIRTANEQRDNLGGQLPIGQIPGSRSLPWESLIDRATGKLLSTDELAALAHQAGLVDDVDIVVYGRFGVETGLSWLVLKHLGYSRVLTYDRGWVEWASTPGLPITAIDH